MIFGGWTDSKDLEGAVASPGGLEEDGGRRRKRERVLVAEKGRKKSDTLLQEDHLIGADW